MNVEEMLFPSTASNGDAKSNTPSSEKLSGEMATDVDTDAMTTLPSAKSPPLEEGTDVWQVAISFCQPASGGVAGSVRAYYEANAKAEMDATTGLPFVSVGVYEGVTRIPRDCERGRIIVSAALLSTGSMFLSDTLFDMNPGPQSSPGVIVPEMTSTELQTELVLSDPAYGNFTFLRIGLIRQSITEPWSLFHIFGMMQPSLASVLPGYPQENAAEMLAPENQKNRLAQDAAKTPIRPSKGILSPNAPLWNTSLMTPVGAVPMSVVPLPMMPNSFAREIAVANSAQGRVLGALQASSTNSLPEFLKISKTMTLLLREQIDTCPEEELGAFIDWLLEMLRGNLAALLVSKYGNFAISAVFEVSSTSQRAAMLDEIKISIAPVSCSFHGMHAMQKIVSLIDEDVHARTLIKALIEQSLFLATDPNGVFVLRSCIGYDPRRLTSDEVPNIFRKYAYDVVLSVIRPTEEPPMFASKKDQCENNMLYESESALFPVAIHANGSVFLTSALSLVHCNGEKTPKENLCRVLIEDILRNRIAEQLARHSTGFKLVMNLISKPCSGVIIEPLVNELLTQCGVLATDRFGAKVFMSCLNTEFGQRALDLCIPDSAALYSILASSHGFGVVRHILSVASTSTIDVSRLKTLIRSSSQHARDPSQGDQNLIMRLDSLISIL